MRTRFCSLTPSAAVGGGGFGSFPALGPLPFLLQTPRVAPGLHPPPLPSLLPALRFPSALPEGRGEGFIFKFCAVSRLDLFLPRRGRSRGTR